MQRSKTRSFFTNHTKQRLLCQYALPHTNPHPPPSMHFLPHIYFQHPSFLLHNKSYLLFLAISIYILSIGNHQEQQLQDQELIIGSMDTHKNPNTETTHNTQNHILPSPSSSSQEFKTTHRQQNSHDSKKNNESEGFISKSDILQTLKDDPTDSVSCSSLVDEEGNMTTSPPPPPPPAQEEMEVAEESGRDRLKRHRVEMAGRVWIPDIWGHEDLLKDWIDCTVFDSSLGNKTIMSARASLVQERRRSTLRIENRC